MLCFQLFRSISDILDNGIPQPLLTTSMRFCGKLHPRSALMRRGMARNRWGHSQVNGCPISRICLFEAQSEIIQRRDVATSRRVDNHFVPVEHHRRRQGATCFSRISPTSLKIQNVKIKSVEVVRSGWGILLSNTSDILRKSWKHNIMVK